MKKLIILSLLLVASQVSFAQYFLSKGQSQLNAGLGFSSWGLPVYIGFDAGVHPDISVGGEFSFRSYNNNYQDNKYRHNIIGISANGNYHFNSVMDIPKEWDFYAGLNLGFYFWNSDPDYNGDGSSGLGLGAQVGGRYYFSNKFGINLEVGGGNAFSGGKFGVTVRL